jgi:phage I-like protein
MDEEYQLVKLGDIPGLFEAPVTLKDEQKVELADASKKTVTWQIAYPLVSKSHSSGEFQLTTKNFEEIVTNYRTRSTGQIQVCFEHHASLGPEDMDPRIGSPAQGWVRNLSVGSDGCLYGEVELYEPARGYVKDGKYKFMSPAIRFGTRDKATGQNVGCSIEEVSLTNLPHLEKQKGVWINSDKSKNPQYNKETNMDELEKLKLELEKLRLQLQAKEAEVATLKSSSDEETKKFSEKLETAVSEAEAKVRSEFEAKAEVEVAFSSYKEKFGLKDAQKASMLKIRLADKAAFDEMYPKVETPAKAQSQASGTPQVPSYLLGGRLTLDDDSAASPRPIAQGEVNVLALRDRQAELTRKFQGEKNPVTGKNYDVTESIKLAFAQTQKEFEGKLWQLQAVMARHLTSSR